MSATSSCSPSSPSRPRASTSAPDGTIDASWPNSSHAVPLSSHEDNNSSMTTSPTRAAVQSFARRSTSHQEATTTSAMNKMLAIEILPTAEAALEKANGGNARFQYWRVILPLGITYMAVSMVVYSFTFIAAVPSFECRKKVF
ncbi:unnamed protein product, partial [Amoebophrya sp. A120]|eukprot:GSA120T00010201001.1